MLYRKLRHLLLAISAFILFACANSGRQVTDHKRPDFYGEFVAEQNLQEVDRIFPFRYRGWTPLDERYMIVNLTANRAYLLRFNINCLDATMEQRATIASRNNMYVPERDAITFVGSGQSPCFADKIYPLTKEQSLEIRQRKEFRAKSRDRNYQ